MQYQNNKNRLYSSLVARDWSLVRHTGHGARATRHEKTGLTLLEMILAMTIMAIVFAVIVPQFRPMLSSWDSKAGAAEVLQNGRVLIDHLHRNLSKAVRITTVSGSGVTEGYIVYEDNDGNTCRYAVESNYVEFGVVGDLNDLAGPVSSLQFTCYDACDLDTPITDVNTDVNSIRFVEVQTTLTNSAPLGADRTFTTSVYLRVNDSNGTGGGGCNLEDLSKGTPFEFEGIQAATPALSQIDNSHYLLSYAGGVDKDYGWASVLTVNTGTWEITEKTPLLIDDAKLKIPALARIDSTHHLLAYGEVGTAVVLTVNTETWEITQGEHFVFGLAKGKTPALAQIDPNHFLLAYEENNLGYAVVLTVDTDAGTVTKETPFLEFSLVKGKNPALAQIDPTHYLLAYEENNLGHAVVLIVNTGTWVITQGEHLVYDGVKGLTPALAQINSTHYLLTYSNTNGHGIAVVLTVNAETVTKKTPYEYDSTEGKTPALAQIDSTNYLCAYDGGTTGAGWSVVLTVDTGTWDITTTGSPYEYDSVLGETPALAQIDDCDYLCAYEGEGSDGYAVVLKFASSGGGGGEILP